MQSRLYAIRRDGYTVAMVHGELDAASAPRLHADLIEIITTRQGDAHPIVIADLCGVTGCTEAGVELMVNCAHYAAEHGVAFALVSLLPPFSDLFRTAGQAVARYDDLLSALLALAGALPDGPA